MQGEGDSRCCPDGIMGPPSALETTGGRDANFVSEDC